MDDGLKSNTAVVLAAVTQDGMALQFAASAMRDNRDMVLAATKHAASAVKGLECFASVSEIRICRSLGGPNRGAPWVRYPGSSVVIVILVPNGIA